MQGGLDHDDGVGAVLPDQRRPEERRLVRGAVEDLQELRPIGQLGTMVVAPNYNPPSN